MTRDEAGKIANDWIATRASIPCRISPEHTREVRYGWVFYWNSVAFLDYRDQRGMLLGNAPLLILRETREVVPTGTARSTDHYLRLYEIQAGLRPRPSRSSMARRVLRDLWLQLRGREWSSALEPSTCDCLTCRCDTEPRPVGS